MELLPELVVQATAVDKRTREAATLRTVFQHFRRIGLAAAAMFTVGFAVWGFRAKSRPEILPPVTYLGAEAHAQQLPDGSTVLVRGKSRISHEFSETHRRILLSTGEAFFHVAHDPSRPFTVEANGISIRAVGTAFNVRRASDGIDLIVTEGGVMVVSTNVPRDQEAAVVNAGQMLRMEESTGSSTTSTAARPITPAEIETALKWRTPQLEFHRAYLPAVVAAFEKHTARRIELGDPSLAQRTISGTFQADNVEGFLRLAELSFGLKVERSAHGRILLHPAR